MDQERYSFKIENDFDQTQEVFVFDENNITERTLEYIKTDEYKRERKLSARKIILLSLIFIVLFQATALIVHLALNDIIKDLGIQSLITVLISITPIVYLFKNRIGNSLKIEREKFKFSDLVYFFGLMYLFSIIFSSIANILMTEFDINSVDVTANITDSMNAPLFIYAVLIGPFLEELQFRGYYMNYLRKYGASFTILLTSLTFSFMHLNFLQSIGTLGIAFVIGFVGYAYSFKAAVILHILNNFFVFLVGNVLANYDENSPVAIAVSIIIIIFVIYSFMMTFTKKRKAIFNEYFGHYRKNRNKKIFESDGLYALLSDWMFWLYLVFMVSFSIYIGSIVA